MLANATYFRQNSFFVRLSHSEQSALLLDYDWYSSPVSARAGFRSTLPVGT